MKNIILRSTSWFEPFVNLFYPLVPTLLIPKRLKVKQSQIGSIIRQQAPWEASGSARLILILGRDTPLSNTWMRDNRQGDYLNFTPSPLPDTYKHFPSPPANFTKPPLVVIVLCRKSGDFFFFYRFNITKVSRNSGLPLIESNMPHYIVAFVSRLCVGGQQRAIYVAVAWGGVRFYGRLYYNPDNKAWQLHLCIHFLYIWNTSTFEWDRFQPFISTFTHVLFWWLVSIRNN